jgi:UDP-N-acetylenolpyruvoylglucosamine reductase
MLSMQNQTVTAYVKSDADDVFRPVGSTTTTIATNGLIGMLVTSHAPGTVNSAVFENVGINP